MTSLTWANYSNPDVMHGYVDEDRPWLLSPPQIPIEGATRRDPEHVRVMVYHGLTYSHSGLTDPAVMPGYGDMREHWSGQAWIQHYPSGRR